MFWIKFQWLRKDDARLRFRAESRSVFKWKYEADEWSIWWNECVTCWMVDRMVRLLSIWTLLDTAFAPSWMRSNAKRSTGYDRLFVYRWKCSMVRMMMMMMMMMMIAKVLSACLLLSHFRIFFPVQYMILCIVCGHLCGVWWCLAHVADAVCAMVFFYTVSQKNVPPLNCLYTTLGN